MPTVKRIIVNVENIEKYLYFFKEINELKIEIVASSYNAGIISKCNKNVFSHYNGVELKNAESFLNDKIIHSLNLKNQSEHQHCEFQMIICDINNFREKVESGFSRDAVFRSIESINFFLLRMAAINYQVVTPVIANLYLKDVLEELLKNQGNMSLDSNFKMALETFSALSGYDSLVTKYFRMIELGEA